MDPTTATAGLIALAIGLVKIIEKLTEWAIKKVSPETNKTVVQLDQDTSRILHDIHARTVVMSETMIVKDGEGIPMVYSSRIVKDTAEDVRSTAMILKDISYMQQKLLDRIESLDERVIDVLNNQKQQNYK